MTLTAHEMTARRLALDSEQKAKFERDVEGVYDPLEREAVLDRILLADSVSKAPTFRANATIRERGLSAIDRLGKAELVLVQRRGWEGDDPEENRDRLREMAEHDREGLREELDKEVAPGLVANWEALDAEYASRRNDISNRMAKTLGGFLTNVPLEGATAAALIAARDESVLDGYDDETAAAHVVRRLVDAGGANDLLDGAQTPEDEDKLFRLVAKAPVEKAIDPYAHLSDRELEKAMAGGQQPKDVEVAPGVFLSYEHSNDPKEAYADLVREVRELDAAAAKKSAERGDDDENGFKRFFRP